MERGVYYGQKKITEKESPSIYYDDINIESLPNEHWLPIFDSVIPGVKPYYYISDQGRLYSTVANNGHGGLKKPNPCSNSGYVRTGLMIQNGTTKQTNVHRLVLSSFNPIEDSDRFLVNHIDGNKINNTLNNLEWCTPQQNVQHAYDMNLINKRIGENHHSATHSESLIRKICEGLEQGLSIPECAEYAGMEVNRDNRRYISKIKRKQVWNHISDQYNIPEDSYGIKRKLTDAQIHKICWDIQAGLSDQEILDKLIPDIKGPERYKYQRTLYKIRNRIGYNDITDFYEY